MKNQTKNYEIFKTFPGNRPIDKGNLNSIISSISERNLIEERPILVNELMEVLDGQHRLEACKILQIPVWYEVKNGGSYQDIIYLNSSQRSWKGEDYLRLYADGQLLPDYLKLKKYMENSRLKLNIALLIVNGPIKQMGDFDLFRKGQFKFPENDKVIFDQTEKVMYVMDFIKNHNIKPFHRFHNSAFIRPLLIFLEHHQLNWEIFLQKLEANWFKIGTRPSTPLYLEMLTDIYNIRNQNKIFYESLQINI